MNQKPESERREHVYKTRLNSGESEAFEAYLQSAGQKVAEGLRETAGLGVAVKTGQLMAFEAGNTKKFALDQERHWRKYRPDLKFKEDHFYVIPDAFMAIMIDSQRMQQERAYAAEQERDFWKTKCLEFVEHTKTLISAGDAATQAQNREIKELRRKLARYEEPQNAA